MEPADLERWRSAMPKRELDSRLVLASVQRAVARLPEEQRAILLLVCVEGQSYKAAAEVLEIPLGTVMSRLARARLAIGRALEGESIEAISQAKG
jgi:RNA polymerase sigma-70 factor (ECF subfamily)